jgi:hypothetical protein
MRVCIQKFPDWVNNGKQQQHNNNKHLRSITKGYGGKTNLTDSQNRDTTAPSATELYHLQFSLKAASPETFGYILVKSKQLYSLCHATVSCVMNRHPVYDEWFSLRIEH